MTDPTPMTREPSPHMHDCEHGFDRTLCYCDTPEACLCDTEDDNVEAAPAPTVEPSHLQEAGAASTPMTREPDEDGMGVRVTMKREGREPNTYVTLDCGHTAPRYNNLRSDPVGWQTHCDVCNATRTVTAWRRREPRPAPMTREQAWERLVEALSYPQAWLYPNAPAELKAERQAAFAAAAFLRTEMERLEGENEHNYEATSEVMRQAVLLHAREARIAELEALVVNGANQDLLAEREAILRRALAALPDTEGPGDEAGQEHDPSAHCDCDYSMRPDTEGEQHD